MTSAQHLVRQIRRKQLLVCAYREPESAGRFPTLEDLTELLEIGAAECEALVDRLRARGLITLDGAGEGAARIRLTGRGERLLDRMAGPSRGATA